MAVGEIPAGGHAGEGVAVKTCSKCGETKALEEFHRNAERLDGRVPHCKPCVSEYGRRRAKENADKLKAARRRSYEKNREEILAKRREYVKENKEKVLECNRRNYEKNREERIEYRRRYREENREVIANSKSKYAKNNKEKVREAHRRWSEQNRDRVAELSQLSYDKNRRTRLERGREHRAENPEMYRANSARRRASKRLATVEDFTYDELLAHYAVMEYDGCAYCGKAYEHDDHIVPLVKGGPHSRENLAPACARCNLSKGGKYLAEWLGFAEPDDGALYPRS